jgi:uncharacterized protein YhaN
MRITAFHIEGFGIFCGFGQSGLGDGLTVFYGPNEAGKSTMLDFLRYTLFGYPDRRSRKNLREPLHGGSHGGRLEIVLDDGKTATVECFAGQAPQLGLFGDEGLWGRTLQGITRETFQAYFAFDLEELSHERFKDATEIGATLLGAAQTGRLRSPKSVSDELVEQKDEIYKKKGQKQSVRIELERLRNLRREIELCRQRPREYEEKRRALEELDRTIAAKQTHESELRQRLDQARDLQSARPLYFGWREADELLARTEKIESFPPDGVARLEQLDREAAEVGRGIEKKKGEIAELRSRRAARPVAREWLENQGAIRDLAQQQSAFEERRTRVNELDRNLEGRRRRARETLERLGAEWTADRVRTIATDVLAEDRIAGPAERLQETEQTLDIERKEAEQERRRLELLEERLRNQQAGETRDGANEPEALRARLDALDTWLDLDTERRHETERLGDTESRLARARADLAELENRVRVAEATAESPSVWIGAAAGAFVSALIGIVVLFQWQIALGIGLLVVGLFLALVAGGARDALLRLREARRKELENYGQRRQAALIEAGQIEREREQRQSRLGEIEKRIAQAAQQARIEPAADPATVRTLKRQTEETRDRAEKQAEQRGTLRQLEEQLAETHRRLEDRRKRIEALETQGAQAQRELRSALEAAGLPVDLTPKTALEVFRQILHLRQLLAEVGELEEEKRLAERAIEEFAGQVFALARRLSAERRGEWSVVLRELDRRLQEEQAAADRERDFDGKIVAAERELALLEQQQRGIEDERAQLLSAGGAPGDDELFRRRAEQARLYSDALAAWKEARARLEARRASDRTGDEFAEALGRTDWGKLESETVSLEEESEALKREYKDLLERRGRLANEIERIEQEERLFDLRQQEEATRARLAELAHRWNVLAVADALMRHIQEIYDRERQPARVRQASELFRRFTRGRFERVKTSDDGKGIVAVRPTLEELGPEQLSRGTCEQLYLAMRLALVEELRKERGIALPLIFDDILVNFDDERARATAEALAELARDRQVWYFTAHRPTLTLLREVGVAREVLLAERTAAG